MVTSWAVPKQWHKTLTFYRCIYMFGPPEGGTVYYYSKVKCLENN